MPRKFKALGLAFVAMVAMSAIVASSASAQFESNASPTQLTVASNSPQEFTYKSGSAAKVTCNTVTVSDVFTGTATEELTVTPTYTECAGPLGLPLHVEFNSCDYNFTLAAGQTTGTAHIECTVPGDSITHTITSGSSILCQLHIGPQTIGSIVYSNEGGDVKLAPNLTGIDATRTGSALCGAATSSTGEYVGPLTVSGEDPETGATRDIGVD